MQKLLTVAELIEKLTPATLTGLGVGVQAISNWKAKSAIPAKHWPGIAQLASGKDDLAHVTLDYLAQMHTRRPARAQRESGGAIHSRGLRALSGGG